VRFDHPLTGTLCLVNPPEYPRWSGTVCKTADLPQRSVRYDVYRSNITDALDVRVWAHVLHDTQCTGELDGGLGVVLEAEP
jgi:hypothetical protein